MDDLRTGDTRIKLQAAEALREVLKIRPDYPEVVRALVTALRDSSDAVRIAAASALTAEGVETVTAIDGLHEVMHDSAHADVRASVLLIISRLSPQRAIALLPYLCEVLEDPSARVRTAAVGAIGAMGSAAHAVVPSIAKMSADSSAEVRQSTLRALVNLEADHATLLTVSRNLLSDSSAAVRAAAVDALRSMGAAAAPAVGNLVTALSDPDRVVARSAVLAIVAMGSAGKPAIPALKLAQSRSSAPDPLIDEALVVLQGSIERVRDSPEPTLLERCINRPADSRC